MKLLREFDSLSDAKDFADRFERKGILTHVSSQQSKNLSSFRTGAIKAGVWVVLSVQYDDAFQLLNNKSHRVKSALSLEEVNALKSESKEYWSSYVKTKITFFLNGLSIALLVLFVIWVLYKILVKN